MSRVYRGLVGWSVKYRKSPKTDWIYTDEIFSKARAIEEVEWYAEMGAESSIVRASATFTYDDEQDGGAK